MNGYILCDDFEHQFHNVLNRYFSNYKLIDLKINLNPKRMLFTLLSANSFGYINI